MATLKDYFHMNITKGIQITQSTELIDSRDGFKIPFYMYLDFLSGAIYLSFYLTFIEDPFKKCLDIIRSNAIDSVLKKSGGFSQQVAYPKGSTVHASSLKFCGRIYIYSELDVTEDELQILINEAQKKGLIMQYFGPNWAKQLTSLEKPLAFILHDKRDADSIARPLAIELINYPGCVVWFDEFSLKVGDDLRESIEKGIKECKKCILIITPNFLNNKGWGKEEFNAIFTRQLLEESKIILPIWHNVSKHEVYKYSPSLANKLALKWEGDVKVIAKKIYQAAINK